MLRQNKAERDAFWEGYGTEFKDRVDKFGTSGGQFLSNAYDTLSDPEGRRQLSEKLVAGAGSLGKSTLENLGYLGESIIASQTPEGALTISKDNAAYAQSTHTAPGQVRGGNHVLKPRNDAATRDAQTAETTA